MKRSRSLVLFLIGTLFLGGMSGCGTLLRSTVDPAVRHAFPPVSIDDQQRVAIKEASEALRLVKEPGLLLNVGAEDISKSFSNLIQHLNTSEMVVKSAAVRPSKQSFTFLAEIQGNLIEQGIEFDATVEGAAVAYLDVSRNAIVRPVLKSARLTRLRLEKIQFASRPVADAINAALKRYIDNVNGAIPKLEYKIVPKEVGLSTQPVNISIGGGRNITLPGVNLGAMAVLIDNAGLHLLADIELRPPLIAARDITTEFDTYHNNFWELARSVYGGVNVDQSGLYFSDEALKRVLVNGFPPLPIGDLQTLALTDLQQSISNARVIAMGAYLSPDIIRREVKTIVDTALTRQSNKEMFFSPVAVRLDQQSILIDVPVAGTVTDPKDPKGSQFRYFATASLVGVLGQRKGGLYYRLVMAGLTLDRVEHLASSVDPKPFLVTLNRLLDQLVPYINSVTNETPIQVPLPALSPINISSESVHVVPSQLSIPPLTPLIIYPRLDERGLRLLIAEAEGEINSSLLSEDRISGFTKTMDQMIATSFNTQNRLLFAFTTPPIPPDPTATDRAFNELWDRSGFATVNSEAVASGAVSLSWLTGKIGAILTHNQISLTAGFDERITAPSIPLEPFPKLSSRCSVDPPYPRRSCERNSCSRNSCSWDCRRCVNWGLGTACADDLFCLAGQAACNLREEGLIVACNAREETAVATCNAEEEVKVGADNIKRNLQASVCDLTEELVKGINGLTNLGDIGGDAHIVASIKVDSPALNYDSTNNSLILKANSRMEANASGNIDYTAKGLGHVLICPFSGQIGYNVNAVASLDSGNLDAAIAPVKTNKIDTLLLEIKFDDLRVRGKFDPAPLEALLVQNPQIQVLCSPVAVGIVDTAAILGKISAFTPADFIGAITQAIPNLSEDSKSTIEAITKGTIDKTIKMPAFRLDFPSVPVSFGASKYMLLPRWDRGSISLTAQ